MTYRYSLVKCLHYPRTKFVEKVVFVDASDLIEASDKVKKQFPEWEVSMFWPEV